MTHPGAHLLPDSISLPMGSMFAGYPVCSNHIYFPLTPTRQVVDTPNGKVQILRSNVRDPSIRFDDADSNYERKIQSCETLAEQRTKINTICFTEF